MEKDTVLYKHIRKSDGIIFYIGIGDNKRPYIKSGRNQHWHNTVKKYGYSVEIITDNLTWDEACDLETKFIAFYGRKDLGLGTLVNWTDGGEGAKNPSPENLKKMSDRVKGDKNPMYGKHEENPMYGKHFYKMWVDEYGQEKADSMFKEINDRKSAMMSGENNPMYNKTPYEIWVEKYGIEEADRKEIEINEKRRKSGIGNLNAKRIKIINIETNIIYNSIQDVVNDTNIKYSTLYAKLNPKSRLKNNTPFRYYEV